MATSTRRFAWLPREPQPQPLSDKAVQIVQILQRFPKGLSASEIVKRSGGTFLVNHVYVYLRRLQARGIVHVTSSDKAAGDGGQRDVLRATLTAGQIVRRGGADAKGTAPAKAVGAKAGVAKAGIAKAGAAKAAATRGAATVKGAAPAAKPRRAATAASRRAPAATGRGAAETRRNAASH